MPSHFWQRKIFRLTLNKLISDFGEKSNIWQIRFVAFCSVVLIKIEPNQYPFELNYQTSFQQIFKPMFDWYSPICMTFWKHCAQNRVLDRSSERVRAGFAKFRGTEIDLSFPKAGRESWWFSWNAVKRAPKCFCQGFVFFSGLEL